MSVKTYIVFVLVLAAAITAGVLLRSPDNPGPVQSPHEELFPNPPVGPDAPSRENASPGVKESISHLRQVVEANPDDVTALFELARLLQDAHNANEAATYYERGLQLQPDNIDARIDYSLCLFSTGRVTEALEQNRIVSGLQPGNLKALYNIGAIHANRGNVDSAEHYWSQVVSLDPKHELAVQAQTNIKTLHERSIEK